MALGRGLSDLLGTSQETDAERNEPVGQDLIRRSLAAKHGKVTKKGTEGATAVLASISRQRVKDPQKRLQTIQSQTGDVEKMLENKFLGTKAMLKVFDSGDGVLLLQFHSIEELETILRHLKTK